MFGHISCSSALLPLVSGLGDLRNDNDANCTYEGDNNVLLQQTSNVLVTMLQSSKAGQPLPASMTTVQFINDMDAILGGALTATTVQGMMDINGQWWAGCAPSNSQCDEL